MWKLPQKRKHRKRRGRNTTRVIFFGKTANFQTLTPSLPHAENSIIGNDMTVGIPDKATPQRRRCETWRGDMNS